MPPSIDFSNPLVLGVSVGVAILLLVVVVLLVARARARKKEHDNRILAELRAAEREQEFTVAAQRVKCLDNPVEAARAVAYLLHEYLSMPVLVVYAAQEGAPALTDLLGEKVVLPHTLPAATLEEFNQARLTRISALVGPAEPQPSQERESNEPVTVDLKVVVLPWFGSFGWSGLIMFRAGEGFDLKRLDRIREPLGRLGEVLATSLELSRKRADLDETTQRARRAAHFSVSLIKALDETAPLDVITREVALLVGADSAALWRVDDGNSIIKVVASYGLRSAEFLPLPVGQGLAGAVLQSGEPLWLEDAPSDPRCLFPREARESGIGSYLGVSVAGESGPIGVIEVHTVACRQWTVFDVEVLQMAGEAIAEVVRSTDARGNRIKVESAYLGLSEALQRLQSRDEVMEAAVEVLGHALGVSRAMIIEFDGSGRALPIKHEYRDRSAKSGKGLKLAPEMLTVSASTLSTGQLIIASDARETSLLDAATKSDLQVRSELAVPVKFEGQVHAVICLHECDRFRDWASDEAEFAQRVGRQLGLSLANLRLLDSARNAAAEAAPHLAKMELRVAELEREVAQLREAAAHANNAAAAARAAESEARAAEALARAGEADARNSEAQARAVIERLRGAEAEARAAAEAAARSEAEARRERDELREDEARARRSAQQLLEINRLKSDFIVNAGRELEASLQSLLGFADQVSQGLYGPLTAEQAQGVRNIVAWARRMSSDVEWLIEYGSTRSRRLETGEGDQSQTTQVAG